MTKSVNEYLLLIALLITTILSCRTAINKPILSYQAATDKPIFAYQVLERLIGESAKDIHLILTENDGVHDWFWVKAINGKVTIEATTQVALSYGAYSYFKDIGAASISWEGKRVSLPTRFPDYDSGTVETPFTYRAYLNVCAYGYTTPWWDIKRWEQEIDWMALHGINMPVSMEGQEIVWQQLWNEYNIPNTELANYFSGPAFLPWQRMGNIAGHLGPLPQTWVNKKHLLQKKILQRMRTLGMQPITPAFNGYVPEHFVKKYPNAKIHKMKPWSMGFKETYWLDPADPLFTKIGKRFIELYRNTYGDSHYYLLDAFNEMTPPIDEKNRYRELAEYGNTIFQSIRAGNPNGIWVMQGWMFGHNKEFWSAQSIQAFLSKVPSAGMIIQDIGNDRYGVWESAQAFYGKPWIYGFIHNYGGSNPVYGDFRSYNEQVSSLLLNKEKGNLVGFGAFPEGLNNNSVVYEYIFDLAWSNQKDSLEDWLAVYTQARYGKTSANILAAWKLIEEAVFQTKYWHPRWWNGAGAYLLFKRPTAKIIEFQGHPGDTKKLGRALGMLLKETGEYKQAPLFLHDLVDFSRHYITLTIDSLLIEMVRAYQENDPDRGDLLTGKILTLVEGVDLLLGTQPESLTTWLGAAQKYATNAAESAYYVHNAKTQITIWGGEDSLKDYASKAWQGMYKDFYWPRWEIFIIQLKQSILSGEPFDENKTRLYILKWEKQWIANTGEIDRVLPKDPVSLIVQLLKITATKE